MSQKFYKLRHKPTGLFYQPTKGRWSEDKTNLSKTGKIYSHCRNQFKNQELFAVSKTLMESHNIDAQLGRFMNILMVQLTDLEWVEYEVVERQVIPYVTP